METSTMAKSLAANTRSAAAQTAAARITALRGSVLTNPHVHDAPFAEVYTAKTRLPSAKKSVKRQMSEAQMLHVINVDKRPDVLVTMVKHSLPTAAVLDALLDQGLMDVREAGRGSNTDNGGYSQMSVRDALAMKWAYRLPMEWLTSRTADELGRLRVCLLARQDNLDLDALKDALDDFERWGNSFDAPAVQWVLTQNPGIVPMLASAPVASSTVQTALAGSHLFGKLSAQQQMLVLDLTAFDAGDGKAAHDRLGEEWFNTRSFAWMAAGGNPTTHHDVAVRIEEALRWQTKTPNAADNVKRRLRQFWRIDDFATTTDPVHRSGLVQHVALGAKKKNGRAHSLPALVANPTLEQAEVAVLRRHQLTYDGWEMPSAWSHPAVGEALADLDARFDLANQEPDIPLTLWWRKTVLNEDTALNWTVAPEEAEKFWKLDEPASWMDWEVSIRERIWFEQTVGENEDAWNVLIQLMPTFEGSVRELAAVATAVA